MPSLPDPKVLRLPRTDVDNDFVLVNIEQSGSDPLDLKLVGTDAISPFVTHLRQNHIHKLQASTSQSDPDHWQAILSAVLLQSIPNDPTLSGVEAVANVSSSQLTITIRNKISGITVHFRHNPSSLFCILIFVATTWRNHFRQGRKRRCSAIRLDGLCSNPS